MSHTLFKIGRIWLIIDAVIFSCVGILLAIAPDCFVFNSWNTAYRELFGPQGDTQRRFLLVPLGATFFGSYVLTGFIAAIPLAERKRWAWWALLISFLGWFVLDSAMSLLHGAWFNFLQINLFALTVQGVPILITAPWVFEAGGTALANETQEIAAGTRATSRATPRK